MGERPVDLAEAERWVQAIGRNVSSRVAREGLEAVLAEYDRRGQALAVLRELVEMHQLTDDDLEDLGTTWDQVQEVWERARAAVAAGEPEVRNRLCEHCGRWHDSTGQQVIGWENVEGTKRRKLPEGHMPPDYRIDAATGWEPIYGHCEARGRRAGCAAGRPRRERGLRDMTADRPATPAEPVKDDIDRRIRDYLAPDMDDEAGEMVTTWVLVAITSTVDGDGRAATHVIPDRVLPVWQVKGVLHHALDALRGGSR